MILPNLIPSEGPIDFKASYDNHTNTLYLAFKDPATWCQTGSIVLKCNNSQTAVRWLYKGLNAVFEGDGLTSLWGGGNAEGRADGKLVVPISMLLAKETLLTDDVYTIWFTGPYQPFETRKYSLEMILTKRRLAEPKNTLCAALVKVFDLVSFPKSSFTERGLLEAEYSLHNNTPLGLSEGISKLSEIFILRDFGKEQALVDQLGALELALDELLR